VSNLEILGVVGAVWFAGVFITAYVIGRFNIGGDADLSDTDKEYVRRLIAMFWPAYVLVIAASFAFRCLVHAVASLIDWPFRAGQKVRAKSENPSP